MLRQTDWKIWVIIILLVAVGFLAVVVAINRQNDVEQEIKFDQLNKEEKQKLRDEAVQRVYSEIDTTAARIDTIIQINETIKYVPYEKIKYIDRTVDDAVRIIDTTEYGTR